MTAIPILLADAVTTVINTAVDASTFAVSFTPRRSYPDWDLSYEDLDGTEVDVVFVSGQGSGGDLVELDSVGSLNYEPSIDVCVRHRFGPSDREPKTGRLLNASVDPLVKLVEQLQEVLAAERQTELALPGGPEASWINASVRTYVNQRRLREGFFEGVVRINFGISRGGI
jgi:hypothetical protein